MRNLWYLLCLLVGACTTPQERCLGPWQSINAPLQSKAAQTSSSADQERLIP
jgi:hypothetical protein